MGNRARDSVAFAVSHDPLGRVWKLLEDARRELQGDEFTTLLDTLIEQTAPLAHGTVPSSHLPASTVAQGLPPEKVSRLIEMETIFGHAASTASVGDLARIATCIYAMLTAAKTLGPHARPMGPLGEGVPHSGGTRAARSRSSS